MRFVIVFWVILMGLATSTLAADVVVPAEAELVGKLKGMRSGPRLFWPGDEVVRARLAADPVLGEVSRRMVAYCDGLMGAPVLERKMTGRRLLHVSRDAISRVATLAYAYRVTGEAKYAERARAELKAVCGFTDFNPSHFLDVGEMTMALAIGYDWLGDALSEGEKAEIRRAIVDKGILPSFEKDHGWIRVTNNWNQVCHGGLVAGAVAIGDKEPEVAARVIRRAVENVPAVMRQYGPDGAYPEGPMYWEYGTVYNVMMIAALEGALGTDFGLSGMPGFMRTADYFLHMNGPSGNWFSYCDCAMRGESVAAAPWWFAKRRGDHALVRYERQRLEAFATDDTRKAALPAERFSAVVMAWGAGVPEVGSLPVHAVDLRYVGGGDTPVAVFRTGWGDEDTWVGVKAGSPGVSHGHMDVGQFVIDSMGVRWAEDLGMQNYESLESKKVGLWDGKEGGKRWEVFRMSAESHNILTVVGEQQRVAGRAEFTKVGENFVVMDNTEVYGGRLAKALRGVKLVDGRGLVRVRDEVAAPAGEAVKVRWAFATKAEVGIAGNVVTLTRDGKLMVMTVRVGVRGQPKIRAWAAAGKHEYDAENPGVTMVGFEMEVGGGESALIEVDFVPAKGGGLRRP